jgi:hypothetical protein
MLTFGRFVGPRLDGLGHAQRHDRAYLPVLALCVYRLAVTARVHGGRLHGESVGAELVDQRHGHGGLVRTSGYDFPGKSWGHRSAVSTRKGGGFYGYKVHLAAFSRTGQQA